MSTVTARVYVVEPPSLSVTVPLTVTVPVPPAVHVPGETVAAVPQSSDVVSVAWSAGTSWRPVSEIVNVAPSLTVAGAVNVAVGATFAAVTVTDADDDAPDGSVTVTWKTYVPLSGAVNVGLTAVASDSVTAGPVPPVRDHA